MNLTKSYLKFRNKNAKHQYFRYNGQYSVTFLPEFCTKEFVKNYQPKGRDLSFGQQCYDYNLGAWE
jgi:hypothetical protein